MALRQPPQPTPRALRGCHQPGSRVAAAGRPQAVPDDHRSPIWNIARQRMARPRRTERLRAGGSQLDEASHRGTHRDDHLGRYARRLVRRLELVPSLQIAYVWHASIFTREVLNGLERIGFLYPQQIIWNIWNKGRTVLTRTHY